MGVMRIETLKARLRRYLEAEAAILHSAEYQLGERKLRRADLSAVRAAIKDLEEEIDSLETSNGRIKRCVFTD